MHAAARDGEEKGDRGSFPRERLTGTGRSHCETLAANKEVAPSPWRQRRLSHLSGKKREPLAGNPVGIAVAVMDEKIPILRFLQGARRYEQGFNLLVLTSGCQ